MKKVLHILASNIYSGAENVACTIIENLKDEYEMVYSSPKGDIENIIKNKGINYIGLGEFSVQEIKRVVAEYKPDIIHAHDYRASTFAVLSGFKGKIISHIHNNCDEAKTWNKKTLIYALASRKFNKVIGVSDEVYNEAIYKKNIKNKYVTIPNFVDSEKVLEKASEYEFEKKYDLFYFGRLLPEKNPLEFINIVAKIKEKHQNITAVMIGDGDLREQCYELIKANGLKDNIELVGFKQNPFPIVKNCKVGIMPSKWEGFGLTAIESMILGKPVLNSGAGGLKQIFANNKELVCNEIETYSSAYEKIIRNKLKIDFTSIVYFTDKSEWKDKIKSVYN